MKTLFSLALFLLIYFTGASQPAEFTEKELDKSGGVMFARLPTTAAVTEADAPSLIAGLLPRDLQNQVEVRYTRSFSDNLGATHSHFSFFYKGIEIYGAEYVAHSRNGKVEYINGTLPAGSLGNINLPARQDPANAITIALQRCSDKRKSGNMPGVALEAQSKGLFLLFQNERGIQPVYKVEVISRKAIIQDYYFIDVNTGNILMEGSNICSYHAEEKKDVLPPPFLPGTAATLYSGTQTITGELTGGLYRLKDMRRTMVPIHTQNANGYYYADEVIANATEFYDNDNNWTIAEHPADRTALDAHWAMELAYDYWYTIHGRNSLDDYGRPIDGYVHVGVNDEVTYYDLIQHTLNFTDGAATFNPLTELDIVTHEYGHGICQYTCNLYSGNSFPASSINEGLSDIWGACNEHWAAPSKNPWLSGEEITKVPPYFYRSLNDPFTSKKPQPNTYQGTYWLNPSSDPHINAGVLCHWFYILVNGGAGWNNGQTSHAPAGNGFAWAVNGIDWSRAEKIVYRTEQLLSSSADYLMVRTMSIQAARELYGAGSCEEVSVTKAWYAVGVGNNWVSGNPVATPLLNGAAIICSNPETYYVNYAYNGTPACGGETIVWSATPSNLVNLSCTNCTQTTLSPVGNGFVTLKATVTSGAQTQEVTKSIKVGAYSNYQVQLSGYTMVPLNYTSSYSVNLGNYPGLTNLSWSWPAPPSYNPPYSWSLVYNGGSNYIALRSGSASSTGSVNLSFTACGVNSVASKWVAWGYGGPSFRMSPNPASDILKIEQLDSASNMALAQTTIQQIEMVNKMGLVVYRKSFAKGTANGIIIPVSSMPNDVYTIRVFDGKEWKSEKIVVQH